MTRNPFRRWNISIWSILVLTVIWMMVWGSWNLTTIVGGLVVATIVEVLFPLPHVRMRATVHPWGLIVLSARFIADLIVASVQVAWLTIRPGRTAGGVVMDLELVGDDELLQVITAEMVSLVPGSVVIDLDPVSRVLTLHAIDVRTRADAERVRQRVRDQEERVLRAYHPHPERLLSDKHRARAQRRAARHGPAGKLAREHGYEPFRPDEEVDP